MRHTDAALIAARRQLLRNGGSPYVRAAYAKAENRKREPWLAELAFVGFIFVVVAVLAVAA